MTKQFFFFFIIFILFSPISLVLGEEMQNSSAAIELDTLDFIPLPANETADDSSQKSPFLTPFPNNLRVQLPNNNPV